MEGLIEKCVNGVFVRIEYEAEIENSVNESYYHDRDGMQYDCGDAGEVEILCYEVETTDEEDNEVTCPYTDDEIEEMITDDAYAMCA